MTSLFVFIGIFLFFLFVTPPTYVAHICMLRERENSEIKPKYISFSKFKKMAEIIEWHRYDYFPNSLFNDNKNCKIHAAMIEFNGINYYFDPIGWKRFQIWMNREIKSRPIKNMWKHKFDD